MPGAAKHKVGETRYSKPNDTDLVYERLFDAPIQLVFDAYTKPEHLTRWLLGPEGWTMPVCEMDLRPGGGWRWGWARSDGRTMEMMGKILEIAPPTRLVMTENWGPPWPESTNDITFTAVGDQTLVTCIIRAQDKDSREAALSTGATGGMDTSFARLDSCLASRAIA
ncbi:MAG TPA: SRPBCC domain-containing protein [Gemmatimonadaceae bacterium]|nr:SRPBCC domain-containing protein [Gemmatimonadaceae bacterium]